MFYHLYSQSEHDEAVDKLNKMLNEVESGLSDAEHRKPVYDENDVVDLTTVMAQLAVSYTHLTLPTIYSV